jgi:CHAT domain-containing protein/Flp pilus assembly protein TadD
MMAGRTLPAIRIFDRALDAARIEGRAGLAAFADAFAGVCLLANRQWEEARARYRRAIESSREAKEWKALALALEGIGQLELKAGRREDAAARSVEALGASLRAGDAAGAGVAVDLLCQAAGVEAALGRADLKRQFEEAGRTAHPGAELADLLLRAGAQIAHQAPAKAEERTRLALRLAHAAADDQRIAAALSNLGYLRIREGQLGLAQGMLEQAQERARKAGDERGLVQVMINLALAHKLQGRLSIARRLYGEALSRARALGLGRDVGVLVSNLARVHEAAGDLERALAGDLEALGIHQKLGPPRAVAIDLSNLGATYARLGRLDDAEKSYLEARRVAEGIRDHDTLEAIFLNHGHLQKVRGKIPEARALYQAALDSLRRVEKHLYEPVVLSNLAWLDAEAGRCEEAVPLFVRAAHAALRFGDIETGWTALYGEAFCARRSGDVAKARRTLGQAIALVERQRAGLAAGARGGRFFSAKVHHLYRDAVDLALQAGDTPAAFELAERSRARTLLEALAGGRAVERSAPEVLRRWLAEAAEKVAAAERALIAAHATGDTTAAAKALEEARRRHDELLDAARPHATTIAARRSLADIQASLPPDAALLEYVLLPDRIAMFLLRRDRLAAATAPLGLKEVRRSVEDFRKSMTLAERGEIGGRWKRPLRHLFAALVGPVRAHLQGARQLYVVPSGVLNLIPFGALLDGDRPLVEDFAVTMLPAASALLHVRRPIPPRARLLALGNPAFASKSLAALPAAEAEARAVAAALPGGEVWLGADASEARLKGAVASVDILHLATHGEPNPQAPLFSALHLAPGEGEDGRLEVHEILRLDLRAALVVLSACQTALQAGLGAPLPAGEDFIGLIAALLEAGAASVLATLWPVADRSTAELMGTFYRALPQEGRAQALRSAQRALRRRHPHPFFWAPFVLVGDGS